MDSRAFIAFQADIFRFHSGICSGNIADAAHMSTGNKRTSAPHNKSNITAYIREERRRNFSSTRERRDCQWSWLRDYIQHFHPLDAPPCRRKNRCFIKFFLRARSNRVPSNIIRNCERVVSIRKKASTNSPDRHQTSRLLVFFSGFYLLHKVH